MCPCDDDFNEIDIIITCLTLINSIKVYGIIHYEQFKLPQNNFIIVNQIDNSQNYQQFLNYL